MALLPPKDETELLGHIAVGNRSAFDSLFVHYHGYVFAFAKKLTHSEEMAQEIVQDIFLKLWVGREKLAAVEVFGAYLNRLVRNHCFNVLRQLSQELKSNEVFFAGTVESDEYTAKVMDFKETQFILNSAIATLSPQQRKVYELCHQQGMKYEEAAKEMGISPQTVHAYMKDALSKIRLHFKKFGIHYGVFISCLFK